MEEREMNPPDPIPKRAGMLKWVLVLLAGLVVGGGIIYFMMLPKAKDKAVSTPTPTPSSSPTPTPDRTVDWTPATSVSGHYSLRYNPAWKSRVCPDNPQTLFLAPTTAALALCNSGFGGQMMVTSAESDQRTGYRYGAGYKDLVTAAVTVAGVSGERQSATVDASAEMGPEVGTKLVQYVFFTGGRTYLATYQQTTSGAVASDVLSDFDLMVQSTLKF